MAYKFKRGEKICKGLRRIALEQTREAIENIDNEEIDRKIALHEARKHCKKSRGLLRLLRPGIESIYKTENAFFRDAAKSLSDLRDAQSIIEAVDKLINTANEKRVDTSSIIDIRNLLVERRDEAYHDENELRSRLSAFRKNMSDAEARIKDWDCGELDDSALGAGLMKTYKRGRKRMAEAFDSPSVETFHEWRKCVKYHWYHIRLIEPIWPAQMQAYRSELSALSDLLGEHHDLYVLYETFEALSVDSTNSDGLHALEKFMVDRRHEIESAARPLGHRIFSESPKRLANRLVGYWNLWRSE